MEPIDMGFLEPSGLFQAPHFRNIFSNLHNPTEKTSFSVSVDMGNRNLHVSVVVKGFEYISQSHDPDSDARCAGVWGQIISKDKPLGFFFAIIPNIHDHQGKCGIWFVDEPGFTDNYRHLRKKWLRATEPVGVL